MTQVFGITEPRIFTKPLRELTPETTHGFEVIAFAKQFLGITLYLWQEWLLIHALELKPDGTYRFSRVFVLVARQNGKTTLLMVLTLWWMFVDSKRFPEHLAARDFMVLGVAQDLDQAEEAWEEALSYCDPDDKPRSGYVPFANPVLQRHSRRPSRRNGKKEMRLKSGAVYKVKATSRKAGRGKSAARIILDELREHTDWQAWAAITKTTRNKFNNQIWGISNAGDARSVVLMKMRDEAIKIVEEWDRYVETGIKSVEEYLEGVVSDDLAIFEWSAIDGLPVNDLDGIRQANPSLGYSSISLSQILSEAATEPEEIFRTETLCQWVTSRVPAYMDWPEWQACADGPDDDGVGGSALAEDSPLCLSIDTSAKRDFTSIAIAGYRDDGRIHGEVVAQRAGMLWGVDYVTKVAQHLGIECVAVQARGCAAVDFVEPLEKAGLKIIRIEGSALGSAAGRIRDRARDDRLRHRSQPSLDLAVANGITKKLGEVVAWNREGSVVDIAGLVALSQAIYGLENLPPEPEAVPPPPPQAEIVTRIDVTPADANLATAAF
ncbi:terminase large subunit domain-containing protein [Lysinibacter cavernae]|uniref:Phage terminase large subunit-like protein n=1 Tax=Lysinibacter cavernae TaxID=1640652 RepID=A0A7X5TSS4_9MICO|nr:terminase large subunit [Lysinibacter cavernae]NIH52538.1 phage terminase large subunit-like protein [Lysinibacter cavernae]